MTFDWAVNQAKIDRAVKELTDNNQQVTEHAVKKLYRKYGGLVREAAQLEDISSQVLS